MKNEKVSLRLAERTVDNKIEFSKGVVLSMTGNPFFPSPVPTLAQVSSAAQNLENAHVAAMNGGVDKTALQNQLEAELDNLMLRLGNHVESIANEAALTGGNAITIITSAGMDYRRPNMPAAVPSAPANLRAESTLNEGEIHTEWDGVHEAHVYVVEITTDPSIVGFGNRVGVPAPGITLPAAVVWTQVKILTQRRFTLTGLVSGTKYAVRIYCVGTHGESAYSNVVVAKAL